MFLKNFRKNRNEDERDSKIEQFTKTLFMYILLSHPEYTTSADNLDTVFKDKKVLETLEKEALSIFATLTAYCIMNDIPLEHIYDMSVKDIAKIMDGDMKPKNDNEDKNPFYNLLDKRIKVESILMKDKFIQITFIVPGEVKNKIFGGGDLFFGDCNLRADVDLKYDGNGYDIGDIHLYSDHDQILTGFGINEVENVPYDILKTFVMDGISQASRFLGQ